MLEHLSLSIADLNRSLQFYDAALGALGMARRWTHRIEDGYREAAVGYGYTDGTEEFALRERRGETVASSDAFHLAFRARSREAVDAFYKGAMQNGGCDNGGCGVHEEYGSSYYAAFVLDPDGYRLEAVILD